MPISIEDMPFFKSRLDGGQAVIDVDAFMDWMSGGDFAIMSREDMEDREAAHEEHARGESLDLRGSDVYR